MTKLKLLVSIILLFALKGNAQYKDQYDTLRKICEGPVFSSCEVMPYLTNGSVAYADTLKKYLSGRNVKIAPGKITLQLVILKSGEMKFIQVEDSTMSDTHELIGAIEAITNQWTPGTQNKHLVCCYQRVYIEVTEDDLKVKVQNR